MMSPKPCLRRLLPHPILALGLVIKFCVIHAGGCCGFSGMFIQLTTTAAPVRLPEEVVAVADHLMSQVAQLQQERRTELLQPPVRPVQVRLAYLPVLIGGETYFYCLTFLC
jgi:hypothetical protein